MRTNKRAIRVLGSAVAATVGDRRRAAVLSVAALTFVASAARADHFWNVGTGDYTNPANWNPATLPNGDNAFINNGGTVLLVDGDTQPPNPNDLRVADTGTGTYLQSGSTLATNSWFRMSDTAGTTSFAQVSGGLLQVGGRLNIAEAGTATFNQTGGTVNVAGGPTELGGVDQFNANTGVGVLNLLGGTFNSTGEVWPGEKGNGALNINSGGTLNLSNWLAVGRDGGTGVVNIGPGGLLVKSGNGNVTLAGANNTINQTGGTFNNSTQTWVGENGTSFYNMSGGTANLTVLQVGRGGGTGTVNLTGGLLSVTQITGGGANSVFNLNGGTLQAAAGATNPFFAGLNTATVSANTTIDYNGQSILVGQPLRHGGTAAIDGGLTIVNATAGSGTLTLGGASTYTGTTTITAGTVLALGNNFANTASGSLVSPVVVNGTLNFTAVGRASGVAGVISGPGPINVTSGDAQFGSSANTYTGAVTVTGGGALLLGTGGTTGALSPAGTLAVDGSSYFGYNRSDNIDQTGPLPGGATRIRQAGTGTTTIGPATGATVLNVSNGVLYVNDASTFNTVTEVDANYPGALAVTLAAETQTVLNLFPFAGNPGGVFALTADTSTNFDFSNFTNLRLGASTAGGNAIVNYTGTVTPETVFNAAGTSSTTTLVVGGGGGTLNLASVIADTGNGNPLRVDINGGAVELSNTANTFSGPVLLQPQGTLLLTDSLAALSPNSVLSLQGGTVLYPANDPAPVDLTTGHTTYLNGNNVGGNTINTSGNTVTYNGPLGGNTTFNASAALTNSGSLTKSGLGTLTFTNRLTATQLFVRQGTLTFDGSSSAAALNSFASIGLQGGDVATLNLSNGAKLTGAADFNIGDTNNGLPAVDTGVVNLSDAAGAGTTLNAITLYVAKAGLTANGSGGSVGILNQTGGTLNVSGNSFIGLNGAATYNLSGGTAILTGQVQVGINNGSTAVLNITGGTLTSNNPLFVGVNNGSSGVVNVTGGAASFVGSSQIGVNAGTLNGQPGGVFNQSGGAVTFTNGFIAVARNAGSTGVYNLTGGTLTSTGATNYFIVGESGNGVLNVSGASTTIVTNGLGIAFSDGISETGTVNQNGGTITAAGLGVRFAQNAGNNAATVPVVGTYNLNAGTLNASSISSAANANGAITSVFNFNGGTLRPTAASATFITGLSQANVLAGGANINTSTFAVTVPQGLLHGGTAPADGGLTVAGTGVLTLSGASTYTGLTTVTPGASVVLSGTLPAADSILDNGTFTFAAVTGTAPAARTKGTVTVGPGAALILAPSSQVSRTNLSVTGLSVATGGRFDLNNNDLIVRNGNLAAVTALVAAGDVNNSFNGPTGIVSSAAAANAAHLTAIAVVQNSQNGSPTGVRLTGIFDTQLVTAADVLVKYTYFGDANLDGFVDGQDYVRIDAGFAAASTATPLTGWYNGDFNYDGHVDGSDYTLIDNAFNLQGTTLTPSVLATPLSAVATAEIAAAPSAVPEPASIGLFAAAAAGLLARRRRA